MNRPDASLPFHGYVVWLTPEQGGRDTGPPPTPPNQVYAVTGYLPPHTVDSGSASVVLDVVDRAAWRSEASGCWLVVDNEGNQLVQAGGVIVITEGRRTVAYFHVESVDAIADAALRS